MKLNFINKAYLVLAGVLLVAIVYRVYSYKSWDRFYYSGSVSAPAAYPVYVREAYFLTADDEDNAWINKEQVNDFRTGWGDEYYSPECYGPAFLPEKLVLIYASYRDRKFYKDTLVLPAAQIRQVFAEAKQNGKLSKIRYRSMEEDGLRFVLGIANEGHIVLWLRGKGFEKEVLRATIAAREPSGDDTHYETRLSKEAYLHEVFSRLDDSLKILMDKGWEANAQYKDSASHYDPERAPE